MSSPVTLCFVDCETTGLDPELHEVWEVAVIVRRELSEEMRQEAIRDGHTTWVRPWSDESHVWQLPVDLGRADPIALNIGHFHERRWPTEAEANARRPRPTGDAEADLAAYHAYQEKLGSERTIDPDAMGGWCHDFARLTWGAHMIGMVPSFDTDRLGRLLRSWGACPGWHYQPVDVESVAAGAILQVLQDDSNTPEAKLTPLHFQAVETATLPWSSEDLSRWFGVDPDRYERHSAMGDACWARDLWDALHDGSTDR